LFSAQLASRCSFLIFLNGNKIFFIFFHFFVTIDNLHFLKYLFLHTIISFASNIPGRYR